MFSRAPFDNCRTLEPSSNSPCARCAPHRGLAQSQVRDLGHAVRPTAVGVPGIPPDGVTNGPGVDNRFQSTHQHSRRSKACASCFESRWAVLKARCFSGALQPQSPRRELGTGRSQSVALMASRTSHRRAHQGHSADARPPNGAARLPTGAGTFSEVRCRTQGM